ncbi:MAG: hypothetical protein ACSHXK_13365 [Oceanococcus sp.]
MNSSRDVHRAAADDARNVHCDVDVRPNGCCVAGNCDSNLVRGCEYEQFGDEAYVAVALGLTPSEVGRALSLKSRG